MLVWPFLSQTWEVKAAESCVKNGLPSGSSVELICLKYSVFFLISKTLILDWEAALGFVFVLFYRMEHMLVLIYGIRF